MDSKSYSVKINNHNNTFHGLTREQAKALKCAFSDAIVAYNGIVLNNDWEPIPEVTIKPIQWFIVGVNSCDKIKVNAFSEAVRAGCIMSTAFDRVTIMNDFSNEPIGRCLPEGFLFNPLD